MRSLFWIVFLFDEVDGLLEYDMGRSEKFFKVLRTLSNHGNCQFIFTGERTLQEATHQAESRFWNFAEKLKLQLFDEETTRKLIVNPMELIGIKIENLNEVVVTIYEATDGHPYLMQFVCKLMLQMVSASGKRILTNRMVSEAIQILQNEVEQNQSYVNIFLAQADTFEQAVAVVIAEYGPITYDDLEQGLAANGFKVTQSRLNRGLAYLQLGHVVKWSDTKYAIKLGRFRNYLFSRSPFDRRIESLRIQFEEEQARSDI